MASFILSTTFPITDPTNLPPPPIPPRSFFPPKKTQLSVNCYVSVLIFDRNAKTITVVFIYNNLEERPKAFLKMFLIDVSTLKLPKRHF